MRLPRSLCSLAMTGQTSLPRKTYESPSPCLSLPKKTYGPSSPLPVIARRPKADVAISLGIINNMDKQAFVYIITNKNNTVLYTGVTSNLVKRIYQHKNKLVDGFSKKYNLNKLIYYEATDNIESAITREKQIKDGSRQKKMDLINIFNNEWTDLYKTII